MVDEKKKIADRAFISGLLDVSTRHIDRLAKEGTITRQDDGYFNYTLVAKEYYENKFVSDEEVDYQREHARLEKIKADKEAIKLGQLRSELYEAKVVEKVMSDIYVTLRTQLLGLPNKIASQLPEDIRAEANTLLNTEIENCLAEMAQYSPEMFITEIDE